MSPSHFQLLGLEPSPTLDLSVLESTFRTLSLAWHPDRVPATERLAAVARTAALNEAYRTLKDPERRCVHLLAQLGVDLERDSSVNNAYLSPALLESLLERREALDEAVRGKKADALQHIVAQASAEHQAALTDTQAALTQALQAGGSREKAAAACARLRYYARLRQDAEDALENAT